MPRRARSNVYPLAAALLATPLKAVPVDELEQRTGIDLATFRAAGVQTYTALNARTNEPPREYALISRALLHEQTSSEKSLPHL